MKADAQGEVLRSRQHEAGTVTFENIRLHREGRVATIELHRPEALNALSRGLMTEFVAVIGELDRDQQVGAVIVSGSDRAFAAGADIRDMADKAYADAALEDWLAGWDMLNTVRTPLVAAVAGYALGGGCELAMMCDIIIAAESARFGQPEVNLGVIPGLGGTQRLTRAVGKATAMDMVLTGRALDAHEALRLGLVSRVVADAELMPIAKEVASTIASKSLPVAYAAKESVCRAFESGLSEGLLFERRAFQSTFGLHDRAEGMQAFLEKRAPEFQHR